MNTVSPPSFGLSRAQRIRKTREFQCCYSGDRSGDQHLLVFAVVNEFGFSRVGVSVSKKHGNAVARNRKKRLLREAWRLSQRELPAGLDMVLVPRQSISTRDEYQQSLLRMVRKIQRRLQAADRREGSGS